QLSDALELLRHALVAGGDLVEGIGDLADDADTVAGQPDREIAGAHDLQRAEQVVEIVLMLRAVAAAVALGLRRRVLRRRVLSFRSFQSFRRNQSLRRIVWSHTGVLIHCCWLLVLRPLDDPKAI